MSVNVSQVLTDFFFFLFLVWFYLSNYYQYVDVLDDFQLVLSNASLSCVLTAGVYFSHLLSLIQLLL